MQFDDPIGPSTSQKLFIILELQKKIKNDKERGIDYLKPFELKIKQLDPTVDKIVVEEWVVLFDEVSEIGFGMFHRKMNNNQTLYMRIKPLDCILKY